MTEYVHVPLPLRHYLPIGLPGGLVPLKAPDKLSEAVAMLRELCREGCHRGFGLQFGIGEQHQHAPLPKRLLLPELALLPTRGDGNHLHFWGTLLHEDIIVEGYDNRRHNGSGRRGTLGNNLIRWWH